MHDVIVESLRTPLDTGKPVGYRPSIRKKIRCETAESSPVQETSEAPTVQTGHNELPSIQKKFASFPILNDSQLNKLTEPKLWAYYKLVLEQIAHGNGTAARYREVKKKIRDYMICRYLPDVLRIARSYAKRNMPSYSLTDTQDLEQWVSLGLIQAFDDYDPSFGTSFMQFANARGKSRIAGSIWDGLRKMQDYPREIAWLRRHIKPMMDSLTQLLQHEPTVEEFIEHHGRQYKQILKDPLFQTSVFNQQQAVSQETGELLDWSACVEDHREDEPNMVTNEWVEASVQILGCIPDQEIRTVIYSYYYLGRINERIARNLKCSTSSVVNKRIKGLEYIRESFPLERFKKLIGKS